MEKYILGTSSTGIEWWMYATPFTYDMTNIWYGLKSLVAHQTSLVRIHNVSILLATISSFSTEPQQSSKTVILHKYTLH